MPNRIMFLVFTMALWCSLATGGLRRIDTHTLIAEKHIVKKVENSIRLKFKLCNRGSEVYYLEKRFIPETVPNTLFGFTIVQDGKALTYRGTYAKSAPASFPQDYVDIAPEKCIEFKTNLSRYFLFDVHKKAEIYFSIFNSDPATRNIEELSFEFHYTP